MLKNIWKKKDRKKRTNDDDLKPINDQGVVDMYLLSVYVNGTISGFLVYRIPLQAGKRRKRKVGKETSMNKKIKRSVFSFSSQITTPS
jgi:hypothetical protein